MPPIGKVYPAGSSIYSSPFVAPFGISDDGWHSSPSPPIVGKLSVFMLRKDFLTRIKFLTRKTSLGEFMRF